MSKTGFDSYVKANDAVMRNIQNQGQNLQAQLKQLGYFKRKELESNTITNPKEDLKGITTRSGVAYQGPSIPSTSSSPPKVMNRDTEVTKDTMLPTNNRSTEDVQPPDLPPHLEYAFLEGDDKLPVIIAKDLKDEEKAALIKVLKSHKRAIAWKLSDIKGVDPEFYTHKILMEEDYEPTVQSPKTGLHPKEL
ncbi:hypothetical protein Tco_0996708 [Tanacetum coccineum]